MRVTIDRLPLLVMGGALLLAWLCADYYVHSATITAPSPELEVWARYDRGLAAQLLSAVLLALLVASIPAARPVSSMSIVLSRISELTVNFRWLWPAVAIGGIAIQVAVKGPLILNSPEYLESNAPRSVVVLATTPAPLYMILTGLVSQANRKLGAALGILCALVLFAYGTRLFAASFLLYSLGCWLGGRRLTIRSVLGALVSVALLFPVPLTVRGSSAHGFFPYLDTVYRFVLSGKFFDELVATVAANVGFGIPLLCYVAQLERITAEDMIISINPATGQSAGWGEIEQLLRVHKFIPYSSLGEWGSFGLVALFLAVLCWALTVRICINMIAAIPGFFGLLTLLGASALASYSAILATQYNTRNVVRMVSFVLLLTMMAGAIRWIIKRVGMHSTQTIAFVRRDQFRK